MKIIDFEGKVALITGAAGAIGKAVAAQAIEDGAQEIDMVMNIGQFMSGNYNYVLNDIKAVVDVAHQF